MTTPIKIAILAVVVAAAIGVVVLKQSGADPPAGTSSAATPSNEEVSTTPASNPLPRLVDLGAGKCIPCKAMEPILEALRHDFQDQFQVTFIDVWQDRAAGEAYGVRMIPTQIFFDAEGNELFRHEGFYSREDILGKWRELGYTFEPTTRAEANS